MHTDVILTNKRCIHAESNYNNTKLKAWFSQTDCSGMTWSPTLSTMTRHLKKTRAVASVAAAATTTTTATSCLYLSL